MSEPVITRSANSEENGSGPSFAVGPGSPMGTIHQPAFRSVPNSLISRAGSRSNRRRTTPPFGLPEAFAENSTLPP